MLMMSTVPYSFFIAGTWKGAIKTGTPFSSLCASAGRTAAHASAANDAPTTNLMKNSSELSEVIIQIVGYSVAVAPIKLSCSVVDQGTAALLGVTVGLLEHADGGREIAAYRRVTVGERAFHPGEAEPLENIVADLARGVGREHGDIDELLHL